MTEENNTPNTTNIPHSLIDQHMRFMSEVQLKCLLLIIRYTEGENKPFLTASIADFIARTHPASYNIELALKELESKGLIVIDGDIGGPRNYSLAPSFATGEVEHV